MLKNRPLAVLCLLLSAGIGAGLFFSLPIITVFAAVCIAVVMLIRPARFYRFLAVTGAVLFIVGGIYASAYAKLSQVKKPEDGMVYTFYAAVRDTYPTPSGTRNLLEVLDKDSLFNGKKLYLYSDQELEACNVVQVYATLQRADKSSRSNGVDLYAYGRAELCTNREASGMYYTIAGFRAKLSKLINHSFDKSSAGFYDALITGNRSGIGDELNAYFSRAGISHILAISGQHFTIIVFTLYGILRKLLKNIRLACAIGIAFAILYTLTVGAGLSVIRACIMCCAVFATGMFNGIYDPFTALSVSLTGILIFSPYGAASVSLQLSFLATAGVITVSAFLQGQRPKRVPKILWPVFQSVCISVAASLFCMPVLLTQFDYVSLVSPLANIAVGFLITPALFCGLAFTALSVVTSRLQWIGTVPDLLFEAIVFTAKTVISLPFSTVSAYMPGIKLLLIPSFAAIILCPYFELRRAVKTAVGASAALVVIVTACYLGHSMSLRENSLIFISDGADDAYIISANGKETVLIDIYGNGNCSASVLKQGFTHLDGYVCLSYNEDTIHRLEKLKYYVNVDTVYLPSPARSSDYPRQAEQLGCKVVFYEGSLGVGDIDFYPSAADTPKGAFLINAIRFGQKINVMGAYGYFADAPYTSSDALVITRRGCLAPSADLHSIDHSGKVYLYKGMSERLERYTREFADSVYEYKNTLVLRYGKDGVWEE